MRRSYANNGRFLSSSAGNLPSAANSSTVPSRVYGFGGQPGMLTTAAFGRIESTPVAPVGFGEVEDRPPHDEHEPIAMMAAAFDPTSLRTSIAGLPASFM